MSKNRCRIIWMYEEYTCYLYGLFSVFRLQPLYAFFMSTHANSWIKVAARQNIIWIRFSNRRAVRRAEAGMALTAIGEFAQWGGVADCSGSRTMRNVRNPLFYTYFIANANLLEFFFYSLTFQKIFHKILPRYCLTFLRNLAHKFSEKMQQILFAKICERKLAFQPYRCETGGQKHSGSC